MCEDLEVTCWKPGSKTGPIQGKATCKSLDQRILALIQFSISFQLGEGI